MVSNLGKPESVEVHTAKGDEQVRTLKVGNETITVPPPLPAPGQKYPYLTASWSISGGGQSVRIRASFGDESGTSLEFIDVEHPGDSMLDYHAPTGPYIMVPKSH